MSWLLDLHLIRFFSFYLSMMFLIGTWRRWQQYGTILDLARSAPRRWPRLVALVREHRNIFLTWGTFLPSGLTLLLLTLHVLAGRLIWPQADFDVRKLLELWPAVPVVLATGVAMVAFDISGLLRVTVIDRLEMEKYFSQAEHWLGSWTAPVIERVTLGRINPRKMVNEEVRKALVAASGLINASLWWTITQTCLRLAFGLSLWTAYALEDWLRVGSS
jgi:hypothetical protein